MVLLERALVLGAVLVLSLGDELQSRHFPGAQSTKENAPLDRRILSALERVVEALGSRPEMMYVDAASGLRFADDRLQAVLDLAESSRMDSASRLSSASSSVSMEEIERVRTRASELAALCSKKVFETTDLPILSRGVLRQGIWKGAPVPADVEPVDNASGSAPHHRIAETISDVCITQLFSSDLCRDLNSTCWEVMTGGQQTSYGLTHQVLFLWIALKLNCTDMLKNFSKLYDQPPADQNLVSKCSKVANEAQSKAQEGFSRSEKDLFLEQVTVCGFIDRSVFKDTPLMNEVLSWQRDDGCFPTWRQRRRRRVKREERVDSDGCSMHTSSVGAAALATFLEIIARAEMSGKPLLT